MNTFEQILEIRTGKKLLDIKAVYIDSSITSTKWAYYLYYFDVENNTFYVNDLDSLSLETRVSITNIVEHIITKAYKREKELWNIINLTAKEKKPKAFNITRQNNWLINIDKIDFDVIRWKNNEIIWFKNPSWDVNDSNEVKLRKLHQSLLELFKNQKS